MNNFWEEEEEGPRPRLQGPRAVFCYFGGATDAPAPDVPLPCKCSA
jgi:hypothetical protein